MDAATRLSEREICELNAYNSAFAELGFSWQWSPEDYVELAAYGEGERVQHYILTEHPHLLKAYDIDALAQLIESLKADCRAQPDVHPTGLPNIDREFSSWA